MPRTRSCKPTMVKLDLRRLARGHADAEVGLTPRCGGLGSVLEELVGPHWPHRLPAHIPQAANAGFVITRGIAKSRRFHSSKVLMHFFKTNSRARLRSLMPLPSLFDLLSRRQFSSLVHTELLKVRQQWQTTIHAQPMLVHPFHSGIDIEL